MEPGFPKKILDRLKKHPFVRLRESSIRDRAYFHYKNRTGNWWWDPVANWIQAEDEEVSVLVSYFFRRGNDPAHPELADLFFDSDYELLDSIEFTPDDMPHEKTFLGTEEPRRCSICEKGYPTVLFRKDAHLILEGFGNKRLFTYDECDQCNGKFGSTYENDLCNMLFAYRVFGRVAKKGTGTPKLKIRESGSFIGGGQRGEPVQVVLAELDDSIKVEFKDDHEVSITMPAISYRPVGAIKAIAKMVWQLLPSDRRNEYDDIRKWIQDEIPFFPFEYHTIFIPDGFTRVGLAMWRKVGNDDRLSSLVSIFYFFNTVIVWSMPDFASLECKPSLMPLMPLSSRPPHLPTARSTRVKKDEKLKLGKQKFDMGYSCFLPLKIKDGVPVILECINDDGETLSLTSFLTTPEEIDKKKSIFRIEGDQFAGELNFEFEIGSPTGTIKFILSPSDYTAGVALETYRFIDCLESGAELKVKEVEQKRVLLYGGSESLPENSKSVASTDDMELLGWLITINNEYGKDIRYPEDPSTFEVANAEHLAIAIRHGKYREKPPDGMYQCYLNKDILSKLIDALSNEPNDFTLSVPTKMKVGEYEFDAGMTHIGLENAQFDEDLQKVRDICESWKDDKCGVIAFKCDWVFYAHEKWLQHPNYDKEGE